MPAFPTHTLFAHMALDALIAARHPLAGVAARRAAVLRVAATVGCDIQCMPYQTCQGCEAWYRHDRKSDRKCLVCGEEALADYFVDIRDGRRLKRTDIERDYYRHTHLVLGHDRGYGVDPKTAPGPEEQPFPQQVVDHLTFCLKDAERAAVPRGQTENYVAFLLGWMTHVVSDALFKGCYRHAARIDFFGHQYAMAMLPAAETLSMTDISYDFGASWPTWRADLLDAERDGGALRHLTMGNPPELYGPHWTAAHGRPDPAVGRVIDAVAPINRQSFHQMYTQPDYRAATPRLDPKPADRTKERFGPDELDLGRLRRYAMETGFYETYVKGVEIYLRIVHEAAARTGYDRPSVVSRPQGAVGWQGWQEGVLAAVGHVGEYPHDWGGRLDLHADTCAVLRRLQGKRVKIELGPQATDYQRRLAQVLADSWQVRPDPGASHRVLIGPPAYHPAAIALLGVDEAIALKYQDGLAGLTRVSTAGRYAVLLIAGLSDFGDQQLIEWLQGQANRN